MEMVFRNVSGLLDAQDAQYAERKLARLNRLIENEGRIELIHNLRAQDHEVALSIWTPKLTLRSEESSPSFRAALDLAVDKLKARIRRTKGRAVA